MIDIVNEIKWHYNKFLGKIETYLSCGSSIRLGENPEFIEYLFATKNGNEVYLNIADEIDIDDRYFIIFKGRLLFRNKRPMIARIKITKPEYVRTRNPFSKKWILTEDEKRDLAESLKSNTTWKKDDERSTWKKLYERSEQDSSGVGWNTDLNIDYKPMPNYMELPDKW